jgi:PKD repeat protein
LQIDGSTADRLSVELETGAGINGILWHENGDSMPTISLVRWSGGNPDLTDGGSSDRFAIEFLSVRPDDQFSLTVNSGANSRSVDFTVDGPSTKFILFSDFGLLPSDFEAVSQVELKITGISPLSSIQIDNIETSSEASGNQPPVAEAGSPVIGTAGVAATFDGSASFDPDGTIATYDWDFGDGNTDNGKIVEHTYTNDGTYNVTLTVTDDGDLPASNDTVAVIGSGSEPPVADAGGPYEGRPGNDSSADVTFDGGGSRDDDGIDRYIWDLGDGTVTEGRTPTTSHRYSSTGVYDVKLTVIDTDSNVDEDFTTATISDGNRPPTADAGPGVVDNVDEEVSFDGSASTDPDEENDNLLYEWDFGDGNTGAGIRPNHTYAAPNDYTVILTVTDSEGVPDSDTTSASIGSALLPPVADANGEYAGNPGVPIQFTSEGTMDPDGQIASYSWNFGDGRSSNEANPRHVYTQPGEYPVRLTVTDNDFQSDFDETKAIVADGNEPPVAVAPHGQPNAPEGTEFTFDGSESFDPDGQIVTWDWDFGDETTGSGEVVTHTYAGPGDYLITLTVTDDDRSTDSDTTTAGVLEDNVSPEADAGGPYTGSVGIAVQFDGSGSTDADGDLLQYDWDYGDGSDFDRDAGPTPSHIYSMAGDFEVTLIVYDDQSFNDRAFSTASIDSPNEPPVADAGGPYGSKIDAPIVFDGSGSSDADGDVVQYDWDFGDTTVKVDAGATPSHTYTVPGSYDVVLTVTDSDDATASNATKALAVTGGNLPPTADAGGPYRGDEGVAVDFDGSASEDPDGTIAQYDWDFGDGNTAINGGPTPSNNYAVADNYQVTLTVIDDGGKTDTKTTAAAIGTGNQPPTADAGGPYTGAVGVPLLLNGLNSSDSDGFIASAQWDFGDTGTDNGLIGSHTYTAPGPYTAKLSVEDNDGDRDVATATVIIGDGALLPPTADADGPYTGKAGAPVTFDGTNSSDPDGLITNYDWTFGDDMTGIGPTPDHTYLAGSIYNVILEVTDDDGLSASDGTLAFIGELSVPPTADANGPYRGRVDAAVTFDGTASEDPDGTIVQYDWYWGDGSSDLDAGPIQQHTYAEDRKYFVTLEVTDDSGETDTDVTVASIGIGNLPPLADAGDAARVKVRRDITFDGTGSRDLDGIITDYDWEFGDGNIGNGPTPTHTYQARGTYFVTLTVTDSDGAPASDFTVVEVTKAGGGGGSSGCSAGSGESRDPTLPLLVLLAVLYLVRRRADYSDR